MIKILSVKIWLYANFIFGVLLAVYYISKGAFSFASLSMFVCALATSPFIIIHSFLLTLIGRISLYPFVSWLIILISIPINVITAMCFAEAISGVQGLFQQLVPGPFFFQAIVSGYISIACNYSSINKFIRYEN